MGLQWQGDDLSILQSHGTGVSWMEVISYKTNGEENVTVIELMVEEEYDTRREEPRKL